MNAKWTQRRRKELQKLRELLSEAGSLNHGSHVTHRILLCERLAKALYSSRLSLREPESFYQFLVGLAIDEDHPKRIPPRTI